MDADGGNPVALIENENWDLFPTWSPDGQWITFVEMVPGSGETNVYSMDDEGGDIFQETCGRKL